jgi:hypothetical protein
VSVFGNLLRIVEAGGEAAGSLEIASTSPNDARAFAEKAEKNSGRDLDKEIPNFDKNFLVAKGLASEGSTQRHNMPVIDTADVKELQRRLESGDLDIRGPWAKDTNPSNPFPQGLSGEKAKEWLSDGIKDGSKSDDVVHCSLTSVRIGDLMPIQRQIYFDKSMGATAKSGVSSTRSFLASTVFIISSDNHIIDGHHRWLSGLLIDPNMTVKALKIDLPIKTLLPLLVSYGDAIGNQRNA